MAIFNMVGGAWNAPYRADRVNDDVCRKSLMEQIYIFGYLECTCSVYH